jgi:hypothetical protein
MVRPSCQRKRISKLADFPKDHFRAPRLNKEQTLASAGTWWPGSEERAFTLFFSLLLLLLTAVSCISWMIIPAKVKYDCRAKGGRRGVTGAPAAGDEEAQLLKLLKQTDGASSPAYCLPICTPGSPRLSRRYLQDHMQTAI